MRKDKVENLEAVTKELQFGIGYSDLAYNYRHWPFWTYPAGQDKQAETSSGLLFEVWDTLRDRQSAFDAKTKETQSFDKADILSKNEICDGHDRCESQNKVKIIQKVFPRPERTEECQSMRDIDCIAVVFFRKMLVQCVRTRVRAIAHDDF